MNQPATKPRHRTVHRDDERGSPPGDWVLLIGFVWSLVAVVCLLVARWGPVRRFHRSDPGRMIGRAATVAVIAMIAMIVMGALVCLLLDRRRSEGGDGERGSAVLEAVIGAPLVILVLVTLIGAARVANAHQVVDDAAGDAARAASLARTTPAATAAARATATSSMSGRGVSCAPMTIRVDISDWRPGGTVGVSLSCTASLADLGLPLLGGTRTVNAQAASVIDTYRQLGP